MNWREGLSALFLIPGTLLLFWSVFMMPLYNPALTQTQLFQANWRLYSAGLMLIVLGALILPREKQP